MTTTHTTEQLFIVALQDLADAELAWGERGAKLRDGSGERVAAFLDGDLARSAAQRERIIGLIEGLGATVAGDANIWLRAIIDDAERDIATTASGPLRDTALIGAFRKGKQAERASYETAIALAARIGNADAAETLCQSRDEEAAADEALAGLLGETVGRLR